MDLGSTLARIARWLLVYPFLAGLGITALSYGVDVEFKDAVPESGIVRQVVWYLGSALVWYMNAAWTVFITPGGLLFNLDFAAQLENSGWLALSIFASWIFWYMVLREVMRAVGLSDPFEAQLRGRDGLLGRFKRRGRKDGVLSALVSLRNWFEMVTKFGKQATAKWASLWEVLTQQYCEGDIFLGRPWTIFGGLKRPIGIATEKHMVTIAGTGSGKSTAALAPNLCLYPGSLLCIDPKGELARITALRRGDGGNGVQGMGQSVFVIDPYKIADPSTPSYNPFGEMEQLAAADDEGVVSFAGKLAEALVRPMGGADSYWDNAARTLLRGLVLFIFVHGKAEEKNLARLRQLLMQGDVEGYEQGLAQGSFKRGEMTALECLIERMKQARRGKYGDVIAGAASSLTMMGANQLGSVITTAQEHTVFLDSPEIQRVSMTSDFYLSDLKKRPSSVYCVLPVNAVTGPEGRWLRMFVLLFIDLMIRTKGKPSPPVLLAIDEFPSLGRLEGIETVAAVMRSYGVRMWVVGQDISQFKAVYPETWTGLIGGAEAVQFMGINHPATVDFIVDLLGQHEVTRQTGEGARTQTRALLDRDQVSKFLAKENQNQIVWFGRKRPMRLKLAPYFEYLPPWYYDADKNYTEPFFRRLYRKIGKPVKVKRRKEAVWRDHKDGGPPPPPPPPGAGPETDYEALFEKLYMGRKDVPPVTPPVTESVPPVKEKPPEEKTGPKTSPPETSPWSESIEKTVKRKREKTAMEELDAMIGQLAVKEQMTKLAELVNLHERRRKEGLPDLGFSHHMVFTGNPGTGKTTAARIVGKIMKEIGLLKSGHVVEVDRAGLVGAYIGHTEKQTTKVIESAMDGVLFIDEAYSLVPEKMGNDFGQEAIQILLKQMEDNRERLVVIVAGYTKEMERFIHFNPGLESRFKNFFHFEDYGPGDLSNIYRALARAAGCRLSREADLKALELFNRKWDKRGEDKAPWGNGRLARNVFEDSVMRMAARLAKNPKGDVRIIEAADMPDNI